MKRATKNVLLSDKTAWTDIGTMKQTIQKMAGMLIDDNYHFVLHYISGCFKNGWFYFEMLLCLEISFDKVVKRSLIYKK